MAAAVVSERKGEKLGGRKAINMIRCFLVINNFGKPRLMKFYERLTNEERQVRFSSLELAKVTRGPPFYLRPLFKGFWDGG